MSAAAASASAAVVSLQTAALLGQGDVVQSYLDSGAAIDAVDSDGCTALYNAASAGHVDFASLLLQHGAAVDAGDSGSNIPLHIAVLNGHPQVVQVLLKAGAGVEVFNSDGETPLHCAVVAACEPHLKCLVAKMLCQPAQVNMLNKVSGNSALFAAVATNQPNMVAILCSAGGDPFLPSSGMLPFLTAAGLGSTAVMDSFLQHAQLEQLNIELLVKGILFATLSLSQEPTQQRQAILVRLLQTATSRDADGLTVELRTFPKVSSAVMVESLLAESRRNKADRQVRQAALCARKDSIPAKRMATQHLIVSLAAADRPYRQQHVHDGSSTGKSAHRQWRHVGALKLGAMGVLGAVCGTLLQQLVSQRGHDMGRLPTT